jgi:hypothetical protein
MWKFRCDDIGKYSLRLKVRVPGNALELIAVVNTEA